MTKYTVLHRANLEEFRSYTPTYPDAELIRVSYSGGSVAYWEYRFDPLVIELSCITLLDLVEEHAAMLKQTLANSREIDVDDIPDVVIDVEIGRFDRV